jgi:hypothetical protein
MTDHCWKTIAFAPAPSGWELRWIGEGDGYPATVPIAGWLTQEQVDDKGNLVGVAAVRVIAAYHRLFSDTAPAEEQENDDGYLATELLPADESGWHVYWNGHAQTRHP